VFVYVLIEIGLEFYVGKRAEMAEIAEAATRRDTWAMLRKYGTEVFSRREAREAATRKVWDREKFLKLWKFITFEP